MRRVVITGIGTVTAFGQGLSSLTDGIRKGKSAVRRMDGWEEYKGLRSLVGAPAEVQNEKSIPRQSRRTMGRMSIFAAQASEQAILDANLDKNTFSSGRVGCVIGSTNGSSQSICDAFEIMLPDKDISKLPSMKFFQSLPHTAAMNVSQYLGIAGNVFATSAACASSLQAIGLGYDLIRLGDQDAVLCGGAEELHPTVTASFDALYAASCNYNDTPTRTPRPFDRDRDGLVCGEGSGIFVIEDLEGAKRRGAKIYAEITGFHTCPNVKHVSQSDAESIVTCTERALAQAGIESRDVDYVNAHATGTLQGDAEEAAAIRTLYGESAWVSGLKGYLGHTLGACGSIELAASLEMMRQREVFPTLNLENVDESCRGIRHATEPVNHDIKILVKQCFAFGGIDAVIICKRGEKL